MSQDPTESTTSAGSTTGGGRRVRSGPRGRGTRSGRLDSTLLLAVVLVLVSAGVVLLVQAQPRGVPASAPQEEPLTRASVVCPTYGDQVRAASLAGVGGSVTSQFGDASEEVELSPQEPARVDAGDGPVVVRGTGDLAPGLTVARFARPAAVAECTPPAFDEWFTGVGAGAEHASTLELVNPDSGRAVVDVTVLGRNGPVDVPGLLGLAVPGGRSVRIDLDRTVPRREDLALHVVTTRGRVYSAVADRVEEVGGADLGADWLLPQPTPSTTNLLLGTPPGDGDRFLTLANPGDDEGRASLEVLTGGSVFAPEGAEEITVPPQATVTVPVGDLLTSAAAADGGIAPASDTPVGLRVSSTVEMTASVRAEVGTDLTLTTATPPSSDAATALLPGGDKELLLAGATGPGTVTVEAWTGTGEALPTDEVEVDAGRAARVDLPSQARLVTLTPDGTPVASAVVVVADGVAVLRPRALAVTGPVPQVRPGLP